MLILGLIIVFNIIQTNLKEQKRTFARIRTFGFQCSSISYSNLATTLFQYVIAMILAIPLGIGIGIVYLDALSTIK